MGRKSRIKERRAFKVEPVQWCTNIKEPGIFKKLRRSEWLEFAEEVRGDEPVME